MGTSKPEHRPAPAFAKSDQRAAKRQKEQFANHVSLCDKVQESGREEGKVRWQPENRKW